MKEDNQLTFPYEWAKNQKNKEWFGMPEYKNKLQEDPEITATFKFRNQNDYEDFKEKVKKYIYNGEKVFDGMQKIEAKQAWYPLIEKGSKYLYTTDNPVTPRFPVYIVSKGRWERNPTRRTLTEMGVDFYMIIEKEEYDNYSKYIDKSKLLILPDKYKNEYDRYWKDNDNRHGAGAGRNFAWEHSIKNGHDWHWVLDDNIESIERLNNNIKIKCVTGAPFYIAEDFVLRYENIAQAGFNYSIFCPASDSRPPYKLNTRIYSCLLIRNDIPYRWRGRYNEDTDLSLRILKDGWCTVQFNAFLQGKRATQTMSGGNSGAFYDKEGTYLKSKMLKDMHPDVTSVVTRFNRVHHYVDYTPFRNNQLVLKKGINTNLKENNYNMKKILNEIKR